MVWLLEIGDRAAFLKSKEEETLAVIAQAEADDEELKATYDAITQETGIDPRDRLRKEAETLLMDIRRELVVVAGPNYALYVAFGRGSYEFLQREFGVGAATQVVYLPKRGDRVGLHVEGRDGDLVWREYWLRWLRLKGDHPDAVSYPVAYIAELDTIYTYLPPTGEE